MKTIDMVRHGLWGILSGVFLSLLIGDELIGIGVCISMIILFELINKFALQKDGE